MDNLERLKGAFIQALGVAPDTDFEALAYGPTQGWDSLAHMTLVAEIENTFDFMMATDDVIGMSSFGNARQIVGRYGVQL
jgi:acyl carrier protein